VKNLQGSRNVLSIDFPEGKVKFKFSSKPVLAKKFFGLSTGNRKKTLHPHHLLGSREILPNSDRDVNLFLCIALIISSPTSH